MRAISSKELRHAMCAILLAALMQLSITSSLHLGPKYLIAGLEILLLLTIGLTAPTRHKTKDGLHQPVAIVLIALISFTNAGQLVLVAGALINGSEVAGRTLLLSALAIFITNIIMFSLWYWELDSPGLSGVYDATSDPHFLFPQTGLHEGGWRPTYFDYFYISLTNSTAFSPTDTMPKTHAAKALMSIQAIIALLTIVLVTARAVNILG